MELKTFVAEPNKCCREMSAKNSSCSLCLKASLDAFHGTCSDDVNYPLVHSDDDSKIRSMVALKLDTSLDYDVFRFETYYSTNSLISALYLLLQMAKKMSIHVGRNGISPFECRSTELFITQQV